MKRKATINYFTSEWQAMEGQLGIYLESLDQKKLHRFRVHIKKLKALLDLCSDCQRAAKMKRCFKPVQKVYKLAGEQRSAFLRGEMAPQAELNTEATQKFRSCATELLIHSVKLGRKLKKILPPLPRKKIRCFYKKQLWFVAENLSSKGSAEQLHECRKRLKSLHYNYSLVQGELSYRLDTGYIDELQEAIGNWHDHWLAGSQDSCETAVIARLSADFEHRVIV